MKLKDKIIELIKDKRFDIEIYESNGNWDSEFYTSSTWEKDICTCGDYIEVQDLINILSKIDEKT